MGEVQWFFDLIKAMGVAGGPVFAVLWWLERGERKACQKESREYLVQVLTFAGQSTKSVEQTASAVAEVGEITKDLTGALRRLGELVRFLNKAISDLRHGGSA